MADRILTLPVAQRGSFVQQFSFPANAWQSVQMQVNSTDWNTIDGLFFGYTARVSIDGGVSWTDWGGLTAVSPTFMKDGVTKVEPGGLWLWDAAFAGGGIIEVTTNCPTPFNWGLTVTLHDATIGNAKVR